MYETKDIYVVIPAYNAARTIAGVIGQINRHLPESTVIVVNDGSSDQTAAVLAALAHKTIVYLEYPTNRGKGAALKKGFSQALQTGAKVIATIDADNQHQPEDIGKLMQKFEENQCDLVIGSRMSNIACMPVHRRLSNRMTSRLISWRTGQEIPDSQCGFRLIKSKVLEKMKLDTNGFEMESELLIKAALSGFKIGSTEIQTVYFKEHSSSMKLFRDTMRFTNLFFKSLFWKKVVTST